MHYYNCLIEVLPNELTGLGGKGRKLYLITHKISDEQLHAISLAEAYRIARLMELEHRVRSLLEQERDGYETT